MTINRYQLRRVAIGCGNSTTVEFKYLSLSCGMVKKHNIQLIQMGESKVRE